MPDDGASQVLPRGRARRRKLARRWDSARQMQAVRQAQAGRRVHARAWRVVVRRVLPALVVVVALAFSLTGHPEIALPVWLGVAIYGAAVIHLDWRDRTIAQEVRRLREESRSMSAQAEDELAGQPQGGQDERVGEQQP